MEEGKGPHPTLGMPTQLPELKRASQYLSYRNLKAALDLRDRGLFRPFAQLRPEAQNKKKHASVVYALAHSLAQGGTHLGSCERTFLPRRCSIDTKMTSSSTALAIRADFQRLLYLSIYQLYAYRLLA